MTFTLTIKLGNDAMQTEQDISDALQALINEGSITIGRGNGRNIRDLNGNAVGSWKVTGR
jgi:hypothetical protein